LSHDRDAAISWEQQTEPIIQDILIGIDIGYYAIQGDSMIETCNQKIQELFGVPPRPVDTHSLAVGFLMGQVGERLKMREREHEA
jgi:hypothetical protein